jgi:hypothetical protein
MGVLFALSLMSFSYSAPRGISEMHFIPDEEWNLEYFVQGLEFENECLCFSSDYVSGRLMKTDIVFESGGRVTLQPGTEGGALKGGLHICKGKSIFSR